ncbi:MAG: hypothetical protein IJD65_07090 [Mailhella sp.]|nr:hypothetical protein [Mailhella sp.]
MRQAVAEIEMRRMPHEGEYLFAKPVSVEDAFLFAALRGASSVRWRFVQKQARA